MNLLFILFSILSISLAQQVCPELTCLSPGDTCNTTSTTDCASCIAAFIRCSNAALSAENFEDLCDCYNTAGNCLATSDICTAQLTTLISQCTAQFNSPLVGNTQCTCQQIGASPSILSSCRFDSFCNDEGVCQQQSRIGRQCQDNNECQSLLFQTTTCVDDECVLGTRQARVNDACNTQSQCPRLATCEGGRCQGVSVNDTCLTSQDCEFGLYCGIQGVCTSQVQAGEPCRGLTPTGVSENDACSLGFVCGASGTCVEFFSAEIGAFCSSSEECPINSYCRFNESFSTENLFNIGTCESLPDTTTACDNDDDCSSLGVPPQVTCECNQFSGERECRINIVESMLPRLHSITRSQWRAVINCYTTNECSLFSTAPGSCAMRNCRAEMECLLASIENEGRENLQAIEAQCAVPNNFTCEGLVTEQCGNEECCDALQNPNPATGQGYLQFEPECLDGGLHCLGDTGCQLCFNATSGASNAGGRPICRGTQPEQCSNNECCRALLTEVEDLLGGLDIGLQFTTRCLVFAANCLRNTGCEFCSLEGGDDPLGLPVCGGVPPPPPPPPTGDQCADQQCCTDRANPNVATGLGYLQFNPECLDGGLNCVGNTGCETCFNPASGGINPNDRPICSPEALATFV